MKTPQVIRRPAAFTLIEMLIVIGIIAVLAALAIPTTGIAMRMVKKVRTQAVLKDITLGIKSYQTEYGRYPMPPEYKSEEPIQTVEGAGLLKVLMGENEQGLNARGIAYIEPPPAKNGAGGLTGMQGSYGLMDYWAEPYEVVMDLNYDNRIKNPDATNDDRMVSQDAPQELVMGAIAYSNGEDKKRGTKDDIASWRK